MNQLPEKLAIASTALIHEYAPELTTQHADRLGQLYADLIWQWATGHASKEPVVSKLNEQAIGPDEDYEAHY